MDPSSIPKQYGGDLDWKWGEMPNLDEPARELLSPLESPPGEGETRPQLLKGPVLFKGDEIEILGKEDGKSRKSTIPVPKQVSAEKENGVESSPAQQTNGVQFGSGSASEEKSTADEEVNANANGALEKETAA